MENLRLKKAASCYGIPDPKCVYASTVYTEHPAQKAKALQALVQFKAKIKEINYPCVGAKSVVNTNNFRFGMYQDLGSPASAKALARDLQIYVSELKRQPKEASLTSFFAFFEPKSYTEVQFEARLWQQLAHLHTEDRAAWSTQVSADTGSPEFGFSFANEAFFIVGLHDNSSRLARQFDYPVLVFNLHSQFGRLRQKDKFSVMQSVIRKRDKSLQGFTNPNLSNFGENTEAKQYSGRYAENSWECPVRFGN